MHRFWAALAAAAALTAPVSASAGVYSDDLSKCLVRSTNDADQAQFVVWVFSAMSNHPATKPYSNFTDVQREEFSVRTSNLMVRLLTADCRKESVAAVKYEGPEALSAAFGLLGEVAMRSLATDASVTAAFARLGELTDKAKLVDLFKEAGIALNEDAPDVAK